MGSSAIDELLKHAAEHAATIRHKIDLDEPLDDHVSKDYHQIIVSLMTQPEQQLIAYRSELEALQIQHKELEQYALDKKTAVRKKISGFKKNQKAHKAYSSIG